MAHTTQPYVADRWANSSPKIPYSDAALLRDLERLREAWKIFQSSRNRDAVYEYLTAVFDLVSWWNAEDKALGRCRRALKYQPGQGGMYLEAFAVVIYCTTTGKKTDKKARSKWARVLRYAAAYKLDTEPLELFIKRKGGINRCASRYARRLGRLAKTC
jgi:hypothetical protein